MDSCNAAFQAFQEIMPAIARAHVESTLPLSLLQEFKSAEKNGGIWKGDVIHTSLFQYWKGSTVGEKDKAKRLSKVAQNIPTLPNPITPLLRTENRMNSITSKECVSIKFHQCNLPVKFNTFTCPFSLLLNSWIYSESESLTQKKNWLRPKSIPQT